MRLATIDLDKLNFTKLTGTQLGWVNEVDISNAIVNNHPVSSDSRKEVKLKVVGLFDDFFECECGFKFPINSDDPHNYCRNCGAKIIGTNRGVTQ